MPPYLQYGRRLPFVVDRRTFYACTLPTDEPTFGVPYASEKKALVAQPFYPRLLIEMPFSEIRLRGQTDIRAADVLPMAFSSTMGVETSGVVTETTSRLPRDRPSIPMRTALVATRQETSTQAKQITRPTFRETFSSFDRCSDLSASCRDKLFVTAIYAGASIRGPAISRVRTGERLLIHIDA